MVSYIHVRVAHHREKRDPTTKHLPAPSGSMKPDWLTTTVPRNPLPTKVAFSQAPRKPYLTALNRILCRNIYQLKNSGWSGFYLLAAETWGDCKTEAEVFLNPGHLFRLYLLVGCPFLQPKKKPSGRQGSGEGRPCKLVLSGESTWEWFDKGQNNWGKEDIKICPSEFWIVNMVIDSQNLQIQYV